MNKLFRKRKICFSEKDYKSPIYRPHGYFKPKSAGKVKAFKCLASGKGIIPLVNTYEVNRTLKKGIITFVNVGEIIQTLGEGAILLVTFKSG